MAIMLSDRGMAENKDFRLKLSSPFIGAFLLARVVIWAFYLGRKRQFPAIWPKWVVGATRIHIRQKAPNCHKFLLVSSTFGSKSALPTSSNSSAVCF